MRSEISIYISISNYAALERYDLQLTLEPLISDIAIKTSKSIDATYHTVRALWRHAEGIQNPGVTMLEGTY